MQITRATDYAVRVMVHLASLPRGARVPLGEIVTASDVSANFLSKVLQRLVRAGMVSSQRGSGGGFCLRLQSERLTLLNILEAMEGPLQLNVCSGSGQGCSRKSWCGVQPFWQDAQTALTEVLGKVTIAELARRTAANLNKT